MIMLKHQLAAIFYGAAFLFGFSHADNNSPVKYPKREISGISVINTPIVQDAEAFALEHSTYPIYKHVMRSWLYGVLMIKANETLLSSVDLEAHAVATLLHDLGWDRTEQSPIVSADRSISYFKELDVQVVSKGISMDFSGPSYGVSEEDYAAVAKAFPKDDLKDSVNGTIIWLCATKPQTTYGSTGKTFITVGLINYIQQNKVISQTGVAVFHFGRHDLQYNLADYGLALRSITRQIVSQLPAESALPTQIFENMEVGTGDIESTAAVLNKLASEFSKMVIILDGVDASNEAGLHELMDILLEGNSQVPQVKVMMTSQNPPSDALTKRFGISTMKCSASDQDLSLYYARAMDEAPVSAEVLDESHTKLFPYQKLMEMADGR
ncbi:hypothetical protein IL306_013055 [Fusarium sp. DS 682]|nr:hypothetical protein IL306_013055 [Fusarium sp. DS 682]